MARAVLKSASALSTPSKDIPLAGSPRLPSALIRQAEALGRREGATLFMVLLAGFQALLASYSGQDDLAVGAPVAGRNRVDIEGLIGFFINTLVLRGNLAGEPTFRELLGRVRETALAAHTHQDVPFERLIEELAPERSRRIAQRRNQSKPGNHNPAFIIRSRTHRTASLTQKSAKTRPGNRGQMTNAE